MTFLWVSLAEVKNYVDNAEFVIKFTADSTEEFEQECRRALTELLARPQCEYKKYGAYMVIFHDQVHYGILKHVWYKPNLPARYIETRQGQDYVYVTPSDVWAELVYPMCVKSLCDRAGIGNSLAKDAAAIAIDAALEGRTEHA